MRAEVGSGRRQPPHPARAHKAQAGSLVDARAILSLALNGSLCAVVELDPRLRIKHREPELLTHAAAGSGGDSPSSWSLRCRISLSRLPRAIRDGLRPWAHHASTRHLKRWEDPAHHEVYAYDPESGGVGRVFSMGGFVDYTAEAKVLLNVALHEESVTGIRRRPAAGDDYDGGKLKVKVGSSTLAR
uniref:Uncharacterized protein n=1 Tax=Setaria italica TaxID=4555 RepID=K3YY72_SETIT